MSVSRFATMAAAAWVAAIPAFAQQAQDHSVHHPDATAPVSSQPQPGSGPSQAGMMMRCQEMMGRMASMGQGMAGSDMAGLGMMGHGMMGQGMTGQGMTGQGMTGQGMGGGAMMSGMAERHVEGRLAFLKTELKITEAQTPQWNAFAEAVRANAKSATEVRQAMMGGHAASGPLPERLAKQEKALAANLAGLKKVEEALGKLYATLDADQKKVADTVVIGPMGMPMGMM